jgi:hypothetical protein
MGKHLLIVPATRTTTLLGIGAGLLLALAGCGGRTPLFGPGSGLPDASIGFDGPGSGFDQGGLRDTRGRDVPGPDLGVPRDVAVRDAVVSDSGVRDVTGPFDGISGADGGAQGFSPWRRYPTHGTGVSWLAVIDLYSSGHLGLAVVHKAESGGVVLLRGRGDGTFEVMPAIPSGPASLVVSDHLATGPDRLIVPQADRSPPYLLILEGGGGQFMEHSTIDTPSLVTGLVESEFDADGQRDIVAIGGDPASLLFIPGGMPVPMTLAPAAPGMALAWGHLDGDRIPDLVYAVADQPALAVLHGSMSGPVPDGTLIPTDDHVSSIAMAKLQGHDTDDIVVAGATAGKVTIYHGSPAVKNEPPFARTDVEVGGTPDFVTVADLNSDGILDLVVVDSEVRTVTYVLGRGDLTYDPPVSFLVPGAITDPVPMVAVGDFDDDGYPDLAIPEYSIGVSIYLNQLR